MHIPLLSILPATFCEARMGDSDRRPQLSQSLTYFMVSVRKISDLILEVQSYLISPAREW